MPRSLPLISGSYVGSNANVKFGEGKNSVIRRRSEVGIGGDTVLNDTNCFTFVLNTGLCSQEPSDWSIWA